MSAQLAFVLPRARRSDPVTSHAAARKLDAGTGPLMQAIRREALTLRILTGVPFSAFDLAAAVRSNYVRANGKPQWKEGTVRSAVSRAPFLTHVDNFGEAPDTKNACRRYEVAS